MQVNQVEIEKDILRKLLHHRFIGEKHTSIDNVPKSFPKHIRGEIKKSTLELARKGFLILKPTNYGLEISVNPRKLEEIKNILFER